MEITVLEARDRVGGRVNSVQPGAAMRGAMLPRRAQRGKPSWRKAAHFRLPLTGRGGDSGTPWLALPLASAASLSPSRFAPGGIPNKRQQH